MWLQKCEDIDECSQDIDWCGHMECKNTVGGHSCECPSGFEAVKVFNIEYQSIVTECHDIDECDDKSLCPENSACRNVKGNYTCECNSGFEGTEVSFD